MSRLYLFFAIPTGCTFWLFFCIVARTASILVSDAPIALLPRPLPRRRCVLSYCDFALRGVSPGKVSHPWIPQLLFIPATEHTLLKVCPDAFLAV